MTNYTTAPTSADLADLADRALAELPAALARHVRGVSIQIEETADDETLAELGLESPWELSGLYHGIPFGQRGAVGVPTMPDRIELYREALLLEWIETGVELYALVRMVLIHEIAHHFGFSDEDIARIEAGP
jgi:predicted Zn-dependent protease with MMP-like domain